MTIEGCPGTCYLNGWVDLNGDNNFVGEQVITDLGVTNTVVGSPLAPNLLIAQLRLYNGHYR